MEEAQGKRHEAKILRDGKGDRCMPVFENNKKLVIEVQLEAMNLQRII